VLLVWTDDEKGARSLYSVTCAFKSIFGGLPALSSAHARYLYPLGYYMRDKVFVRR